MMHTAEAYNPTWVELKSDDGWVVQDTIQTQVGPVVVSKKMVDGFPCFKGETEYDGVLDIPLMIEIAADAESAMEWSSAGVTEAETLARTKEKCRILSVSRSAISIVRSVLDASGVF